MKRIFSMLANWLTFRSTSLEWLPPHPQHCSEEIVAMKDSSNRSKRWSNEWSWREWTSMKGSYFMEPVDEILMICCDFLSISFLSEWYWSILCPNFDAKCTWLAGLVSAACFHLPQFSNKSIYFILRAGLCMKQSANWMMEQSKKTGV